MLFLYEYPYRKICLETSCICIFLYCCQLLSSWLCSCSRLCIALQRMLARGMECLRHYMVTFHMALSALMVAQPWLLATCLYPILFYRNTSQWFLADALYLFVQRNWWRYAIQYYFFHTLFSRYNCLTHQRVLYAQKLSPAFNTSHLHHSYIVDAGQGYYPGYPARFCQAGAQRLPSFNATGIRHMDAWPRHSSLFLVLLAQFTIKTQFYNNVFQQCRAWLSRSVYFLYGIVRPLAYPLSPSFPFP